MKALLAIAMTVALAGTAFAQTPPPVTVGSVDDPVGEVLVNQGEDYVAPVEGLRVREGDQILTKDNSSVIVRYDDDCDVKVEENTVYTVDEPDDCPPVVALGEGAAVGTATAGITGSTTQFLIAGLGLITFVAIMTHSDGERPDFVVSPL